MLWILIAISLHKLQKIISTTRWTPINPNYKCFSNVQRCRSCRPCSDIRIVLYMYWDIFLSKSQKESQKSISTVDFDCIFRFDLDPLWIESFKWPNEIRHNLFQPQDDARHRLCGAKEGIQVNFRKPYWHNLQCNCTQLLIHFQILIFLLDLQFPMLLFQFFWVVCYFLQQV